MHDDTITALATAPGEAAIAIIRISGPDAIAIAGKVISFRDDARTMKTVESHRLSLGWLVDQDGNRLDQVLVSVMRSPHSYTGEDSAEINCHGGILLARVCLEMVLKAGARLAMPGEFTRRAYVNGKLNLQQAEAVVDIIRSRSEKALMMSARQLDGQSRTLYEGLEDDLSRLNALVEASIDFPVEVGDIDMLETENIICRVEEYLDKLLKAAEISGIYRDGIEVAICGKPNVGKSSLLNKLVKKDRAIVTSIPGTTRDTVEEYLYVRGIPVKLIDTAGIRDTEDFIEKIGVDKSREVIERAEIVIFLIDAGTGFEEEDRRLLGEIENKKTIVLVNKEDLGLSLISDEIVQYLEDRYILVKGSVKEETGIDELENAIERCALSEDYNSLVLPVMVSLRQKRAIVKCREYVDSIRKSLGRVSLDCMGVDAWGALEAVGELSGTNLREDAIDRIFEEFCIGK